MSGAEWATEHALALLRKLWGEGKSVREIAQQIGVSRGAVVAKVHRIGLPGRPSPIQRSPEAQAARASERLRRAAVARVMGEQWPRARDQRPSLPKPLPAVEPVPRGKSEPCCWVMVEGGRGKPWLYCDAPSLPGKPLCAVHHARAIKPRELLVKGGSR